jgi:integrase/recombinase XerD
MLNLFRRHRETCTGKDKGRRYRRCDCPIHVEGSLRGEYIRKALDLTSWEAASDLVKAWEASGEIGVVKVEAPTIAEAIEKFLADAKARHLSGETIRKYENLLLKRLLPWCDRKGYVKLKQLTVQALREFRGTWKDGPIYATKNLERLKSFFAFCHPWMKANPATALKPPKADAVPTLPFSEEEMKKILDACDRYQGNRDRMRAFILTMRYSGLRISDTISLRRDQVEDGKILLYQAKTGEPVCVPIPPFVVEALGKLPTTGERFFWNGKGKLRTRVSNWSRYLASVFDEAGVTDAHSHRFRDTAAVGWLLAGVPIEDVSLLLGHSNVKVTWKHYAPWVKERRERLESRVRASWTAA